MMLRLSLIVLFLVLSPVARAADELCPDLSAGRADAPSDMATVQADIERLGLCVERAKLLKELDNVAVERRKMLDKANGAADPMAGGFNAGLNGGLNGIPPLPVSALPPLQNNAASDQTLRPGEKRVTAAAGQPLEDAIVPAAQGWKVRKIWGQKDDASAPLRAQLSDGAGTLITVVRGDLLPSGSVVENISVKGVTLSDPGEKVGKSGSSLKTNLTDLSWEQPPAEKIPGSNAAQTAP